MRDRSRLAEERRGASWAGKAAGRTYKRRGETAEPVPRLREPVRPPTITELVCGDPLPGYSALDMRRQGGRNVQDRI